MARSRHHRRCRTAVFCGKLERCWEPAGSQQPENKETVRGESGPPLPRRLMAASFHLPPVLKTQLAGDLSSLDAATSRAWESNPTSPTSRLHRAFPGPRGVRQSPRGTRFQAAVGHSYGTRRCRRRGDVHRRGGIVDWRWGTAWTCHLSRSFLWLLDSEPVYSVATK